MPADLIRDFGYLTLGTRLKRLGDKLQSDVQLAIDVLNLPVTSAQYPLLAALDRDGDMTIGALVDAIGISQPGVTRMVTKLEKTGLVSIKTGTADQRQKFVTLTKDGEHLIATSKETLWRHIEKGVRDICTEGDPTTDILIALDRIEQNIEASSLFARMNKHPLDKAPS
ncbi:hypothetical protein GCM10017044_05870 [Kordiimonas sediminis]|uniref:HTH marR-type domain-containing protein n=1 Tax=Kordiimonas sediminis TaxID=1735581 RepID=A0A919E5L4_9PROT|nr:MarR family transcriptional regulator [Kordiimonas sediminis]GHF14595.1 hypothetical protein GCM10017044_05870 [Kordiimonas sediminis]